MLAFAWQHCADDQAPARPGTIRFALRATVAASQGRVATSLPNGASLYVSVRQAGGDDVYTLEPVQLLKLGDEYISEPLVLPNGEYALTDFLVADGDGNIVYAAPKEGSELAAWVDDPLPQLFTISNNAIARVDVQVVSVEAHQPAQFGYVAFQVDVLPFPFFQLSVFRADSTQPVFTPADVYLFLDGDTVYHRQLSAGNQAISFPGNPRATYTLVVRSDALTTYRRTFVLQELVAELDGVPLQVTLQPALTFTALYRRDFFQFWMSLNENMPEGSLTIDWGDGAVEELESDNYGYIEFHHVYATAGDYHVSVSGGLDNVWAFALVLGFGNADDIFLNALPDLRSFSKAESSEGADSLDLSHNPELRYLGVSDSNIKYFDIANNPWMQGLEMSGANGIPASVVNKVIADLYQHAVALHLEHGYIYMEGDSYTVIGPPSPEALEMLRRLRQDLGWTVFPESI